MEPLNKYVLGECMGMCPLEEIKLREQQKLLHALEVVPGTERHRFPKADKDRMVKSFCRSAAGKNMQDPKHLRPPHILLKTVNYLLDDVISRNDVPWTMIYDFVMDRLRSIRQDMVIQNASRAHYISILQPIIRFYAYASYRLCEESLNNFDPFINNTHLQECLKRLLCMYDGCDELNEISKNSVNVAGEFLIENRPHFEALYLVLNLGNAVAITRSLNLPKFWRTDLVETALELSLNYSNNNFVRVCRVAKRLPRLLVAAVALHLPEIRRKAFKIMSVAYSSKNLTFPLWLLKDLLLYDADDQVVSDCKHYGLDVRNNGVCFVKGSFSDKESVPPTRQKFIDQTLAKIDLPTLILFGE